MLLAISQPLATYGSSWSLAELFEVGNHTHGILFF